MGARLGTADSDLADLAYLYVHCDDCGHRRRWSRAKLNEAERQGYRSLPTLGVKFRCRHCWERGGSGRNVNVQAILKEDDDVGR